MKIRLLILSAVFSLFSTLVQAQSLSLDYPQDQPLSAAAAAAFANAGRDLAKIAAVAKAYPNEAAAVARAAAKANPANAVQIAASVAKAVPSKANAIAGEVVKESPTIATAGAIVGAVIQATGLTGLGDSRWIAKAVVSSLPAELKTPGNLKTFVEIGKSTGAPESAVRMGASDGSGVGIVTINRATPDSSIVNAGTSAITAAVNAANLAIANMVPLNVGATSTTNTKTNTTPKTLTDSSTRSGSGGTG